MHNIMNNLTTSTALHSPTASASNGVVKEPTTLCHEGRKISRRELLRIGTGGTALGIASMAVPGLARAGAPESVQEPEIRELQAAFHRAKTTQDIDLMMSLWADDAVLVNQGDANSPYVGAEAIRGFFLRSGSFTHRRFSLVPSFKIQIEVHGNEAWLYFECHDVGDYDLASRFIAADLFLAGTVRNVNGNWVFWQMTAGKSSPLSFDHYYFP
jgi:ketosteroid isomerase-like protein